MAQKVNACAVLVGKLERTITYRSTGVEVGGYITIKWIMF